MASGPAPDPTAEELAATIREIRERVRARYPESDAGAGVALPDLLPVLHARDAAEGKVAAIGTVNPRPRGLLNGVVQMSKRFLARLLDWHVREQVEFNRAAVQYFDAVLEALNENNRALAEAAHMQDVRSHWAEWRVGWERKLADTENQLLRSVADLQAAFRMQQERTAIEIQKRFWADMERSRGEIERLIHTELRLIRQRTALPEVMAPITTAAPPPPAHHDSARFAERFRGSEGYVAERQRFYLPHFQACREVLDIGCGRGEFLELMKEAGVPARGIDLSAEYVALCRAKGLQAEAADLFPYLESLPDGSLDGVFCAQVIEHLPPERLPSMLRLACAKLARGGVLAIETPNPECLAIFATHFYLDPTHQRPVPPALLSFYLEEFGVGQIQVHRLSPAVESMPSLGSLPDDFRAEFFGGLDYAVIGRKL